MTRTDIVITAVTAVITLVAVLMLVLELSRRRRHVRKRRARRPEPAAYVPSDQDERPFSFGPKDEAEYGAPPGYGRPAGYGPPPLWHDRLRANRGRRLERRRIEERDDRRREVGRAGDVVVGVAGQDG